jgi:hypothetical protein
MSRFCVLLLVGLAATSMTTVAEAQFDKGQVAVRPEFGMDIDDGFGVAFGGVMTYAITDAMAVGPVFFYSTGGRQFEVQGQNQTFKTAGSNSLWFGGRWYYMVQPASSYPWYIDAGIAFVRYGSIGEWDDGNKIIGTAGNQQVELEVAGATRFAFNFGGGSMFEVGTDKMLTIDVNSYVGSHGDPVLQTTSGEEFIKLTDAGSFWKLTFTVGLSFFL